MTDPNASNRIQQTTVANNANRRRLAPIYVPTAKTPMVVGAIVAVLGAVSPALMVAPIPPPWGIVAGSVAGALAAGLAAFFGMRSAGVRSQEGDE